MQYANFKDKNRFAHTYLSEVDTGRSNSRVIFQRTFNELQAFRGQPEVFTYCLAGGDR